MIAFTTSTNRQAAIDYTATAKALTAHLAAGKTIAYHGMSAGPLILATGERRYCFVPGAKWPPHPTYGRPLESDDPSEIAHRWMLHLSTRTTARLLEQLEQENV